MLSVQLVWMNPTEPEHTIAWDTSMCVGSSAGCHTRARIHITHYLAVADQLPCMPLFGCKIFKCADNFFRHRSKATYGSSI